MRFYTYLLILIVFVGFWLVRFQSEMRGANAMAEGAKLRIRGSVSSQPYYTASKQIVRIGRVFILTEPFPRLNYGDLVETSGILKKRVTELGKPEIWLMYPDIQIVAKEDDLGFLSPNRLLALIHRFRRKIVSNFSSMLPEPQASLLSGVLLGMRSRMPEDFSQALRYTGTMHVVVASGYNVTVVTGVMTYLLLQIISRRWVLPFATLGIVAYTIMAGADPPIVRAAIMGMLTLLGQFFGRAYHGLWALALTALAMAIVTPFVVFDIGFQLSFAATFGILTITPVLLFWLRRLLGFLGRTLVEEFGVTLGAQLAVLPIILLHFGRVSWLSPVVNLVVALVVPIIMGIGGILAFTSFIGKGLSQVLALFAWVPLTFFVETVSWFNRLPFGSLEALSFSSWKVFGYYAFLVILILRFSGKKKLKTLESKSK